MIWATFSLHLQETIRVILVSWGALIGFEILFPLERQSFQSYLRGIRNTLVIIPITSLITVVLFSARPLFSIEPYIFHVPSFLKSFTPLITWFLGDICYYWMHRFQHTQFWWRFHKPHHSLKELNAFNSASHWMESLTSFFFQTIPLMFISIPGEGIPLFSFLFVWGFYIHSNTRVSLGIFRFLFADPKYHRVHHSIDPKHWGKNYAAFFPIIDVIFGTAYFPKEERLRTRKEGQSEPRLVEFLR